MMRNGLPYYKAYPRDFMEGTIGMPFDLKGAYRLVLDLIYMQGGSLPDDAKYISGHLGCTIRAWGNYRAALIKLGKIQVEGEIISNFRASLEVDNLEMFSDKQRQNRLGSRKNKDLAETTVKPTLNQSEPDTDTERKKKIDDDDAGAKQTEIVPDAPTFREQILEAMGVDLSGLTGRGGQWIGTQADMIEAGKWLTDLDLTPDEILTEIRAVSAKKRDGPPSKFAYYRKAMQALSGAKIAPPLSPDTTATQKPKTGGRYDNTEFGRNIIRLADQISAGTAALDFKNRDPFRA